MTAHQTKKLDVDDLKALRDRFHIPISDAEIDKVPYYRPAPDSEEMRYLQERRKQLGGYLPARKGHIEPLVVPGLELFKTQLEGSGDRAASTTMVFVRLLNSLLRDPAIGKNVVPIVPDEARTFGMEGMFRQIGIYSSVGPAVYPAGCRAADVLPRGQAGPDPPGRHQRRRCLLLVARGGHVLCESWRVHDSLLHLLFDVRLPAHRRLHLGGRRHAGQGLPARRDRWPYHAGR